MLRVQLPPPRQHPLHGRYLPGRHVAMVFSVVPAARRQIHFRVVAARKQHSVGKEGCRKQ